MNHTAQKINHIEMVKKVEKYMSIHNWDRMTIGMRLMGLERVHGEEAVQSMSRFIDWAEENNQESGWIAAQLGHDLRDFAESCMTPRTSGY